MADKKISALIPAAKGEIDKDNDVLVIVTNGVTKQISVKDFCGLCPAPSPGAKGEYGCPGDVGDKGSLGPKGEIGPKGMKGDPCIIPGPVGDKGDRADSFGSVGVKGDASLEGGIDDANRTSTGDFAQLTINGTDYRIELFQ